MDASTTHVDPFKQRMEYLFTKLNSSHSSTCYRALAELRKEVIPKSHLFIQAGGMKHIVVQLQKSNKKIVDLSLSILGHCVLEQEPRNIFMKEGGLAVLTRIMQSFENENTILCRACRVIGSLAHDKRVAAKLLIDHSIYYSVGQVIDRSTDEETLSMAIRAIHNLSDSKEHVAILGKNHIYPKLSGLLIKTENVNIHKKLLTTLSHVFNFMKRFTETSAHYWIGSEGGGKLVTRLVDLRLSTTPMIATKAPQVLHQLIQDKHVRPLMASKDAFQSLIPIVKEEKKLGKCGTSVYLSTLLLLCRESPNAFAQTGGIPFLLELIRESDPSYIAEESKVSHSQRFVLQHNNIFSTLLAFKYDTSALMELVEGGVVDILTDRVIRYTESCRSGKMELTTPESTFKVKESNSHTSKIEGNAEQTIVPNCHTGCKIRCRSRKQYRTTSPSYQAVELEYDQFSRLRESNQSNSVALNIFGWNPDRPALVDSEIASLTSSPRSASISSSPTHSLSTWSDSGSDADGGYDYSDGNHSPVYSSSPLSDHSLSPLGSPSTGSMSPLRPPTLPSSSDFEQSDDENDLDFCYSPINMDFQPDNESNVDAPRSPTLPSKKRVKFCQDSQSSRKLCCETDLKMLWLKLGQVGSKDFYENWPEFTSEPHVLYHQEVAVYLLLKLSWLDNAPKQLTEHKTMKAVIDYLVETPRPTFRACQLLFRVSSCPGLFVQLIQTHFPLEVYLGLSRSLSTVHCCPLHSSLRRVGEQILDQLAYIVAQFGRGEIENILLKNGDDRLSSGVVAMSVPLIVKSRSLLRRYVNDLQVLDLIGKELRSSDSRTYAIASLSSLASFLKMDDLLSPHTTLADLFSHKPCQAADAAEDVFFQVTANQTIGGVKSRLQGASFFEAMFRGGFQESQTNVVSIVNIQAPVLKVILHFIYGCGFQCNIIRSVESLVKCDKSALSLLQSLDRFLMLEQLEGISNLIASQDWNVSPYNFIALWMSLDGAFPFLTRLRNHLQYFPFSNVADFDARFRIVDAVLQTDVADDAIGYWKKMFLTRIEDK